ncbi:MAG TPA: hypothetical protein DCZ43_00870 [candidate division Zixibacteria bacterium]|nr:hypothetical protein [candidate division Zixibacteria bacterium]
MERRTFFGWIGKAALFIGMGSLIGHAEEPEIENIPKRFPDQPAIRRARMSGRACHDYRMISDDRSLMLDKDIYHG